MKIYAEKFRGFEKIEVDLDKATFLIGDNSSGKSSIIYLVHSLCRGDLYDAPKLDEDFGVSEYDYFSPYFNNSDVVFAFYDDATDDKFAKIITVKYSSKEFPEITKCTYRVGGNIITLKRSGSSTFVRTKLNSNDLKFDDVLNIHKDGRGFVKGEGEDVTSLGEPSCAIINIESSFNKPSQISRKILSTRLDSSRLVSPVRALPEKFYRFKRKFSAQGEHFATLWMDVFSEEANYLFKDVLKFGRESKLFDGIEVKKISSNINDSPLIVFIKKNDKRFMLNQVGIGVSQVVPVLMDSTFAIASGGSPLLIQQPELHLHPIAQAAFGSYLYNSTARGLRGVYETHSSFLLDRFRADLRDGVIPDGMDASFSHDSVDLLFCENGEGGNSIHRIFLDGGGALINEPPQYHDFFIDELSRTMF